MVLKFKDKNSVILENGKVPATVTFSDSINVVIEDDEGLIISKPGEYEHSGIDVVAREISTDNYTAKSNIAKVTIDGVRVLFLLKALEAKQDDLSQVLEIDILVVREEELDKIDRLTMLYNPKVVVVIPNKLSDEEVTELLKKSFGTSQITVEKQIKPKSDDFESENFIVSFCILKK
jgi:hypothetical protein